MFEARLNQGDLLKRLIESIKDLVTDANFDCSAAGLSMQGMDASHISLVELLLRADGFEHYRCDRGLSMGMHVGNLAKMLKFAGQKDVITMLAEDSGDTVNFMFESREPERIAEFNMHLMDIDAEQLSIPDTKHSATVTMPSGEFARLMKDLTSFGESVVISVTKDGIKFSTSGDIGTANVTVRHTTDVKKLEDATLIELEEPVTLSFGLKFLNSFIKATPLSPTVILRMTEETPLVVEYNFDGVGHIKFFLAPKIEDEEVEDET